MDECAEREPELTARSEPLPKRDEPLALEPLALEPRSLVDAEVRVAELEVDFGEFSTWPSPAVYVVCEPLPCVTVVET